MPDERDIEKLADGRYDAFIPRRTRDNVPFCAITAGPHRGDVIGLFPQFATRDPFDLVGVPCTLVVAGEDPDRDETGLRRSEIWAHFPAAPSDLNRRLLEGGVLGR